MELEDRNIALEKEIIALKQQLKDKDPLEVQSNE